MTKKNVAYLINDAAYFFSHRQKLAEAVQHAGGTVHVIVPSASESVQDRFTESGMTLWCFAPEGNIKSRILGIYKLAGILKEIRPDLVHVVTLKCTVLWFLVAPFFHKLPSIHTIAGFGQLKNPTFLSKTGKRIIEGILWILARLTPASFVVQNTDDAADLCARQVIPASRLHLVQGSGVDMTTYAPGNRLYGSPLRVGTAARRLKAKGIPALAELGRYIKAHNLPIRLVVASVPADGHRDAIPDAQWSQWLDEDLFEDAGHVTDMVTFYQSLDAFVYLSTYGEGLAKTLLEAASCGLPIVTTRQAGCREAIIDGVSGYLTDPLDTAGTAALLARLQDPVTLKTFGIAAREHIARHFADDIVIAQMLTLYENAA